MSEGKDSANRETKPYRAEYAASNRAKCKRCESTMVKDSLKLAHLVKSRFHDGYDAKHCHVKCFFQIMRPKSIAEIANFEKLKYNDQKMLEKAIESNGASVLTGATNESSADVGDEKKSKQASKRGQSAEDGTNYGDFSVELAKSNRSVCVSCQEKISKGSVRFGKLDFNVDMNASYARGPLTRWHHLECFAKNSADLEFYGDVTKVKGFNDIEKDEQKNIKTIVKPKPKSEVVNASSPVKKMKKSVEELAKEAEEEKLLKRQSDRYYKLREIINGMKKTHVSEMLEYMKQKSNFKQGSVLVDMATDIMLFGPLEPCPRCQGHLILKSSAYICTGGTEDNPCKYETRDPNRGAPDLPKEICELYPFFSETYVFKPKKRIFPSKLVEAIENKEAEDGKVVKADAPLRGLLIGVSSWKYIVLDREKVDKKVKSLGGKVHTIIEKSLFMLMTSEDEISKSSPKLEVAHAFDIPFVKPNCLFAIKRKEDVVKAVKDNLLGEYSGDIGKRYQEFMSKSEGGEIKIET